MSYLRDLAQPVTGDSQPSPPIIVHSHLRWDFVWQRPQQIHSRLAAHHAIAFVEEPKETATHAALDISLTPEGVVRVVPLLPNAGSLSTHAQCSVVLPLLRAAIRAHPLLAPRFDAPIQWFYSPMTAPAYCDEFQSVATVYDCMDELSNFRFAPADMSAREDYLLAKADVVFTGGYELYRSKSAHHGNTHFFGCGVDADHFATARAEDTVVPAELATLPRPILGYFGVIDERLDYELIARLARGFPAATIAMVGPLAKVRQEDLPTAPNIRWLGPRSYKDLPAIVKAFDVCLMPFAMNAATQYINPTKTLEYLAAGKPVVSTAVRDVVRQFSDVVDVGDSASSFVELVKRVLAGVSPHTIDAGIARARASSWESTVQAMRRHVLQALAKKHTAAEAGFGRPEPVGLQTPAAMARVHG